MRSTYSNVHTEVSALQLAFFNMLVNNWKSGSRRHSFHICRQKVVRLVKSTWINYIPEENWTYVNKNRLGEHDS